VAGEPEPLILRGNTLYATRPIVAYGSIDVLKQKGLDTAIIEARHLTTAELAELAEIYQGRQAPPTDEISGLFLDAPGGAIDQPPWMRRRKAGG